MKNAVPIDGLTAIFGNLNDLAKEYNLLMAQYKELRAHNNILKHEFELIKENGRNIMFVPTDQKPI
jgi:hypothetical protein